MGNSFRITNFVYWKVVAHQNVTPGHRIVTTCQRSCGKVIFLVLSVCHSVHRGVSPHVTIIHGALDLAIQGSQPTSGPCPLHMGPHYTGTLAPLWSLAPIDMGPHCTGTPARQTCSNFLHYEAHTIGKRAVCILLECFLVVSMIFDDIDDY